MIARALISASFLLIFLCSNAQNALKTARKSKTGSVPVQMVNETLHDTCIDKKFSIVYYIIQDSLNSKTVTNTATLTAALTNVLNSVFKRICVQFENCSTVIIPIYPYNEWRGDIVEKIVTASWYAPNTMNIYLPDIMDTNYGAEQDGYAHAPNTWGAVPGTKDIIVISRNAFKTNEVGFAYSSLVHIVGHYFGLPDTFAEIGSPATPGPPSNISSNEYVRRTNCATNGDGFCDTDADCYPLSFFPPPAPPLKSHCYFFPGPKDGRNEYYTPPLDNFMSMYSCRCKFTQQQYNHMAKFILKNRMNLH